MTFNYETLKKTPERQDYSSLCFFAFAKGRPNGQKETSIIRSSAKYAGESKYLLDLGRIPAGLIDKTDCGCGLTSFAIEKEAGNVVIAVPSISLVENKVNQYPNERYGYELFGVVGGVGEEDISTYIAECEAENRSFKIMTTYDSLPKLTGLLSKAHLIIDEWQMLNFWAPLKSNRSERDYDRDVMTKVVDIADYYRDSVSFITATPLDDAEYLAAEWTWDLNRYKMYWEDDESIENSTSKRELPPLYAVKALSPTAWVRDCLVNPIVKDGSVSFGDYECKKLIVYVNSVEAFVNICKGVDKDNCAILCSDKEQNDERIKGYKRLSDPVNLPQFTFVTSTGWQGIDLYDAEAVSVVISYMPDVNSTHCLVDTDAQLKQILGRQRMTANASYGGGIFVYHRLSVDDVEMYKEAKGDNFARVKDTIYLYNKNIERGEEVESSKKILLESSTFRNYANPKGYKFEANEQLRCSDKYIINMLENYADDGSGRDLKFYRPVVKVDETATKKVRNRELEWGVISAKYHGKISGNESVSFSELQLNTQEYKTIVAFYDLFPEYGKPPKTKRDAEDLIEKSKDSAFGVALVQDIELGKKYTATELAEKLNEIAKRIGIDRTYDCYCKKDLTRIFGNMPDYKLDIVKGAHHQSFYIISEVN